MSLPFLRRAAALLLIALAPVAARAAAPIGLVTIVDGEAVLVRGVARFTLVEGVPLESGDIVETGPRAAIVRVELSDTTVLDLGPETRVLLAPRLRGAASTGAASLYLLQGWIKLGLPAPSGAPQAPVLVDTALADVTVSAGTIVEHATADSVQIFQESGQSAVAEPGAAKGAAPRAVKAGETYQWKDGKAAVQPRPDPALVAVLPRAFRDTLPRRAAQFQKTPRAPKPLPPPTYADLEPWLTAEPALRASLLPRWQRLAKVPEFRSALIAHRKVHPEWERILFPPPPPPPPKPRETGAPPAAPSPAYRSPVDAPSGYTN